MANDISVDASQTLAALTGATSAPAESRVKQKALGQDEFFKLLTTQLASQDPLNPMEDTAFIAQMASFSQLEMTSNMTKSFENFTNLQQFNAAQSYIDRKVTMSDGTQGRVTAVEFQDDAALVFLDGAVTGNDIKKIYKVEK